MLEDQTKEKKNAILNALISTEVNFAKSNNQKWPSLFSNLIEPRIEDLSTATKFYYSLTDEQIELRLAIHSWEAEARSRYESLMGFSLTPMSKSIDSRLWAKREILNVELLLEKGKNQLMCKVGDDFCLSEIPELYNKLIIGDWERFIVMEEIEEYEEANSKYLKENNIDFTNLIGVDFLTFYSMPRKEHFLNKNYIAANEIQALLWYKEFLNEIKFTGATFYEKQSHSEQDKKDPRKYIDINANNLQRSNEGYEAIKAGFDDYFTEYERFPKWPALMEFLVMHPPQGFNIKGIYNKSKLTAINIEGVEKPIDRDAFRNRFNRYFKKSDNKPDNS